MKSKIELLQKRAFLYCLTLLLSLNNRSYSQIVYTDIPDATPNATYSLDLNNDFIVDFIIQFDAIDKVMCKPQNNNAYSGDVVLGQYLPWALSQSTNICNSLTWHGPSNPGTMAWGTSTGYWAGATNKYLALKLVVGTNTYYGWARLDLLPMASSFTVKDYAYESTPNACIQAGKTTTGFIENTPKKFFSIYPNPFTSRTTIRLVDNLKNATLTISNSYGQTVKQVHGISGYTISLSRDNLACGIYYIRIIDENKLIAIEKLLISN